MSQVEQKNPEPKQPNHQEKFKHQMLGTWLQALELFAQSDAETIYCLGQLIDKHIPVLMEIYGYQRVANLLSLVEWLNQAIADSSPMPDWNRMFNNEFNLGVDPDEEQHATNRLED